MGGTNIDGELSPHATTTTHISHSSSYTSCHEAIPDDDANTAAPGESKGSQFLQHYMDELKSQFRGTPRK